MINRDALDSESHPIESLIRKLWPAASRKSPRPKARLWDRRQNYRLNLDEMGTVQVTVKPESGPACKSVLHDLSAGGFSCAPPVPAGIQKETRVTIRIPLPDEPPWTLETEAVYLGESGDRAGRAIARFRFTDALTQKQEDRIHEFVLKSQFQKVRKDRAVPA